MANNTVLNTGTGGDTIRDLDRAGVKTQIVGLDLNPAGSEVLGTGDGTNGLDVDVTRVQGTVAVLTTAQAADGAVGQPATYMGIAGYDGTNFQSIVTDSTGRLVLPPTSQAGATVKTFDADTGAGTDTVAGQLLLLPKSGGSVMGGTSTDPVRTDPTGGTTQPVSGTVTANAGSGTFGTNVVQVAGTATDVNSGNKSAGTQRVVIATDQPALTNALKVDGSAVTQPISGNVGLAPRTSGGLTPSMTISAASTNGTSVKASAGQLYFIHCSNINAAVRYLKFYNKASAPTVGTDVPVLVFAVPGNTAGAGFIVEATNGFAFATGIAFALTTGVATADTGAVAANDLVVNLGYV